MLLRDFIVVEGSVIVYGLFRMRNGDLVCGAAFLGDIEPWCL
jgi:hypothetical protein